MNIQPLPLKELPDLYDTHLRRDFPADELKPCDWLVRLAERGTYECHTFYDRGELCAYACVLAPRDRGAVLLDYFAVLPHRRGGGIGGQCFDLLGDTYRNRGGMLLETELVDAARTSEERETRLRRNTFYQRHGARLTGVHSEAFGVRYSILCLPGEGGGPADEAVYARLAALYRGLFAPEYLTTQVKIARPSGELLPVSL